MDFLDPKKEKRSRIMLLLGYCLVALAIGIATLVLLYQSYGYNVDRQGQVIQNGLLFVSSQPSGATIYMNGKLYKSNTDTRVVVPAASYQLKISETGYRDWQRPVLVNGGDVQHFDYPFLFPSTLQTKPLSAAASTPSVATQSPDKRWLLLSQTDTPGTFTQYDLRAPAKPLNSAVSLPADTFTAGVGAHTWSLVEWANDNRHVLLLHGYTTSSGAAHEYILLDRDTPTSSVNLTNSLNLSQTQTLTLFNNRISQFYQYDSADHTLSRVNGSDGTVVSKLNHVLAFKTYADNKILYVTDQPPSGKATAGQVSVVLQDGQKTFTLRTLPAGAPEYVLNLAQYAGDWYVAVAVANDTVAYVYKNPQSLPTTTTDEYPAPWRRLSVGSHVTSLTFSSNTQFLSAEGGQDFNVYDLENVATYRYHAADPLDQPQTHAAWMDGDRLTYISGGKVVVFDYDYRNKQTLVSADPAFLPFFASNYSYLYTLQSSTANSTVTSTLSSTPLTVKK